MIYDNPSTILPWQMNLKQLEEVFPILQQSTADAISVIEDGYKLPIAMSRTVVFSGDVHTQFLPKSKHVGLEYQMINITSHDVAVEYKYKPDGSSTYKTQKFIINSNGVWLFRYNGKNWNGFDVNNFQKITSDSGTITPTSDKAIIFELGNSESVRSRNHVFHLDSGLYTGIDLEFKNNTKAYIFITYNDAQYLTLPPLCPHTASLSWNGESWENFTQDEWIMPSKTEALANKYAIKKDTFYSRLHVMPAIGGHNENYIKLSADNETGVEIECLLDDSCSFEDDINTINPHTTKIDQVNSVGIVSTDDVIPGSYLSTCALSTIVNSCTIRFDHEGDYVFDQVASTPISSIDLTKPHTNHINIAGIHGNTEVFITGADNENYELNLFQHMNMESTEHSDIPLGSKLQFRNESDHTVEIHYYRDDNVKVTSFEIQPGHTKAMIYWHDKFELYKPMSISPNMLSPVNGSHILTSMCETGDGLAIRGGMAMEYENPSLSYTEEHPDQTVKFKIKKGTRFQFGFDVGHVYTYEAKEDMVYKAHGIPDKQGNYIDYSYFSADALMSAFTEVPEHGFVKEFSNSPTRNYLCTPFTNDTVGKDLYIYACAGLYGTHSLGIDFITSTFEPSVFQGYLSELCGIHAESVIIGGFHYGVRRHTTNDHIAICKLVNSAPNDGQPDSWAKSDISDEPTPGMGENGVFVITQNLVSSWIKNVSIGPVPNSFWDVDHCPQCYEVGDPYKYHNIGGMVDLGYIWADIYEASMPGGHVEHAGGINGPVISAPGVASKFGRIPLTNIDWYTANDIAVRIGKRLPTRGEILVGSQWSPKVDEEDLGKPCGCGVDAEGKYVGESGMDLYNVSGMNLCDVDNNVCEMTADLQLQDATTSAWGWSSNNGSVYFGKSYLPRGKDFMVLKGHSFQDNASSARGPRSVIVNQQATAHTPYIGVRFVCDAKRVRR